MISDIFLVTFTGDGNNNYGIGFMVANNRRLGNLAFKAENFPKAITLFERAVNIDPEEKACWGDMATALMETKAFREVAL